MSEPKFEGHLHKLGDQELVIPALNWKRIRLLMPVLQRLSAAPMGLSVTDEILDDHLEVIHQAITRNYPDFTKEDLEEVLDLDNAPRLFLDIMGMSGLISGELKPGKVNPSIGESSMPA